jgi:predicted amidophosphoribosyltransferase
MQTFHASNALGGVDIGWLYAYHKYRLDDGAGGKVRNPLFDDISGALLDIKSTENRNFDVAVKQFSKALLKEIKQLLSEQEDAMVCIVPSSKVAKPSPGLINIAKALERDDKRLHEATKTILRTKDIDKLATGGNRNISIHRQSLGIGEKIRTDKTYIVLDDIATTGNSMAAAVELLQQNGVRRILPIAIGRTA